MSDLLQYINQNQLVDDYFVEGYNLEFNYRILSELTEFTLVVDISEKRLKFEEKKDEKRQSFNLTPLDFFNLLYHEYSFIVENKSNPLSIIPRLKGIPLSFFDRLYFYVKLSELLNLINDQTLTFIGNLINIEYSRVWNVFFGDNLIKEIDVISDEDKNAILEKYNAIVGVVERLTFLVKVNFEISQLQPHSLSDLLFKDQIDALIKYNYELKTLGVLNDGKSSKEGSQSNDKGITTIIFKKDYIETIFQNLNEFFPEEQCQNLKSLLKNEHYNGSKLHFKGKGVRLADAFKQLFDAGLIVGCKKSDLEEWIYMNFQYEANGIYVDFTPKNLNKIISTKKEVCQNPIFNVKYDKIKEKYILF